MDRLISVIIPVYNSEEYLAECIESIINQTYKNIEILLINDGSKDNSIDVCKKYEKIDNRIKVIDKQNEGAAATRNYGVKIATGEYIMFIDSDDFIKKDMIMDSAKQLDFDEYDIVISKLQIYNELGIKDTYCGYKENLVADEKIKNELISSVFYDNKKYKFSNLEGPVCKLLKKRFILNNNIQFDVDLRYGEDAIFTLQAYIKAEKIYYLNEFYYIYRTNEASVTRSFDDKYINNYLNYIRSTIKVLKENTIYEKYEKADYFNRIRQLQKIVTRYFLNKNNSKKYKELKNEFKKLVDDEVMCEGLKKIDIKELSFSRKVLVILSNKKMFFLLNMFYKLYNCLKKIRRKIIAVKEK